MRPKTNTYSKKDTVPVDPKIYLAVDNCFAVKRWTKPEEWVKVIKSFGIHYAEASADNECDPFYMEQGYLKDWVREVNRSCRKHGFKIANFYSGHGSYTTLGLSHTDGRVRKKMLEKWLKPLALLASQCKADLGFFCHAFSEAVLQDPVRYQDAEEELYNNLASLAGFCANHGVDSVGVEQMYAPHQIPWTIPGTKKLLREVYRRGGHQFYIAIDTGHQTGQRKYCYPTSSQILAAMKAGRKGKSLQGLWLGPMKARNIFQQALRQSAKNDDKAIRSIKEVMDQYPYLFSQVQDGDLYAWLAELGCYSPIIHLQQTDGRSSHHLAFTPQNNKAGVVQPQRVISALAESYRGPQVEGMPRTCEKIYMTLEIFSATADINADILDRMKVSVDYWRKFIPRDGCKLSELVR